MLCLLFLSESQFQEVLIDQGYEVDNGFITTAACTQVENKIKSQRCRSYRSLRIRKSAIVQHMRDGLSNS